MPKALKLNAVNSNYTIWTSIAQKSETYFLHRRKIYILLASSQHFTTTTPSQITSFNLPV